MKMPWDLPGDGESQQELPQVNVSVVTLNDGTKMPQFGLGTYMMQPGWQTYEAVQAALRLGYRMVDTAQVYENEGDVGGAVLDSRLPRDQVFVTTKLWGNSHGYEAALRGGRQSVRVLGLGVIDLLLMHDPGRQMIETFDAMLELKSLGLVRSVGVANFGIQHLEALRKAGRPAPSVNQIEMHPLIYSDRRELVSYCERHGILVQAYGSLLAGTQAALDHPAVQEIAEKHARTQSQVLLRWALDRGFPVIPKTVNPRRMDANKAIFDFALTSEERLTLETELSASIGDLGVYWNPVDQAPVDLGDTTANPHLSGPAWAVGAAAA